MPTHHRDDSFLAKIIQQKFSTSFMSNSKWVKLIAALGDNWQEVKKCLVKLVWDDKEPFRLLMFDEYTLYDFDYYASAMESMVSGKLGGWCSYKEIEWLDFPRTVTVENSGLLITQNLEIIKTVIDGIGQYQLELTPDNLRLYAYRK